MSNHIIKAIDNITGELVVYKITSSINQNGYMTDIILFPYLLNFNGRYIVDISSNFHSTLFLLDKNDIFLYGKNNIDCKNVFCNINIKQFCDNNIDRIFVINTVDKTYMYEPFIFYAIDTNKKLWFFRVNNSFEVIEHVQFAGINNCQNIYKTDNKHEIFIMDNNDIYKYNRGTDRMILLKQNVIDFNYCEINDEYVYANRKNYCFALDFNNNVVFWEHCSILSKIIDKACKIAQNTINYYLPLIKEGKVMFISPPYDKTKNGPLLPWERNIEDIEISIDGEEITDIYITPQLLLRTKSNYLYWYNTIKKKAEIVVDKYNQPIILISTTKKPIKSARSFI